MVSVGFHVLPSIIGAHVQLREFELSDREDFVSGTAAAADGGVTSVIGMPNSKPRVLTTDALLQTASRMEERPLASVGRYVWKFEDCVDGLADVPDLGAIGFRVFTAEADAYDPDFARYIATSPDLMLRIFEQAAAFDALVAIHSESQPLITLVEGRAHPGGIGSAGAVVGADRRHDRHHRKRPHAAPDCREADGEDFGSRARRTRHWITGRRFFSTKSRKVGWR